MNNKKTMKSFMLVSLLYLLTILGCQNSHHPARSILLNPLFTDNMVLQQKQKIPVWGTAEPGGEIAVTLNEQQQKVIVNDAGNWRVDLSPVTAGGPYELIISGEETITIRNVLVGEVWICSGQSNMEMPLAGWGNIDNYQEEIANANYPNIRLLMVDRVMSATPHENFESDGWKECSPKTIPEFSSVAYFFGRRLYRELNVPVGLIESAWGGTPIEAWISGQTLKKIPEFSDIALANEKKLAVWPDKIEQILKDKGTFDHGFQNPEYKTDDWQTMKLPTVWENAGLDIDGIVWFSKDVDIPESWKGEDLILSLGKINDYDITWFNGKKIGRGTDVSESRVYQIPSSFVEIGKNRITVQVLDFGNFGGLYGPADKMKLASKVGITSLVGNWKYIIDPIKIDLKKSPKKPNNDSEVYNGMIKPLLPFGIKGAIWYQGEANIGGAYQYRTLFKAMIEDWRTVWGEGDFPFLFVQLPNFMELNPQLAEDAWPQLREAQTMALALPNTGMAVAIDIGDAKNIHPKNKQEVGRRLAMNALAKVYGKKIPYSGPMYKSMNIQGNKVRLQFVNTDGGLKIKESNHLQGFALAGEDKKFVWAEAEIEGDEVVVWNLKIKKPVAVRYAWVSNPVCNLFNEADLPASPFRTDNWEGITSGNK
ncbi:MAG: sialate O-acetylesterase [Bacteroidota bacterium]|nr:sialate O-acetylesterase [Bacteroidota bacterium]